MFSSRGSVQRPFRAEQRRRADLAQFGTPVPPVPGRPTADAARQRDPIPTNAMRGGPNSTRNRAETGRGMGARYRWQLKSRRAGSIVAPPPKRGGWSSRPCLSVRKDKSAARHHSRPDNYSDNLPKAGAVRHVVRATSAVARVAGPRLARGYSGDTPHCGPGNPSLPAAGRSRVALTMVPTRCDTFPLNFLGFGPRHRSPPPRGEVFGVWRRRRNRYVSSCPHLLPRPRKGEVRGGGNPTHQPETK